MPNTGARILLLGGDTDHNVGDRAIVSALTSCIVAHEPAAKVTIVAGASAAKPIAGVDRTVPRGSGGLLALGRAAIAADRILVAGGGLFQDDDSRAKMPYWAARIAPAEDLSIRALPVTRDRRRTRCTSGKSRGGAAGLPACSRACRCATDLRLRSLAACTSRPLDVVPDPAFMLEPARASARSTCCAASDLRPGPAAHRRRAPTLVPRARGLSCRTW